MNGIHNRRGREDSPIGINDDREGRPVVDIGEDHINRQPLNEDNELEDANSLAELFEITEALVRQKFNIQDFVDIAHPGPPGGVRLLKDTLENLDKDASDDLWELATNILYRIQTLSKELSTNGIGKDLDIDIPDYLHYDALVKVLQQLQDKSVYICVLGRYNVGKTTLINALLRDDILPVSITPETAVTLYIQHDDIIEQSTKTTHEARLIDKTNMRHMVHGKETVKATLARLHSGIRKRTVGEDKNDYLLKINFPLLEASSNPIPFLVDTPGSNEEGELHLQLLAEQILHSAAAYIFVMKYDDIKNKEDYSALKMIYQRDPSIFQSERLTIVITHYDLSFQNTQSFMSVDKLKSMVAQTVSKAIGGMNISPDIIIPVCGKWASDVRHCITHSSNQEIFNDVQMSLVSVRRSAQPNQTLLTVMQQMQSISREDVLKEMGEQSRIDKLEDRIKLVSMRLTTVWRNNIIGSCRSFLKLADKLIDKLLLEVSREVRDINEQTQHASKVVEHHNAMIKSIRQESELLNKFRSTYDRDIDYDTKFKGKIDRLLDELKATLMGKQRVRKYSLEELTTEINAFQNHATTEIKRWFLQTKFEKCQQLLHRQTQRISEKFGRFRAAAALVVEQGGIPKTLEMYFGVNEVERDDDNIDDHMESKLSGVREAELSDIITKTYWFRLKIPFVKANVLNGTVEQIIEERKTAIFESHKNFFAEIKENIILHFFKRYCSVVVKELEVFIRILEDNGEILKLKELLCRKDLLNPKSQLKADYQILKPHLSRLTSHLDITERYSNV